MNTLQFNDLRRIMVDPGEYYVSSKPEVISTLLGSCVAACLYDPVGGIFGMNHFLLAYRDYPRGMSVIQSEEGRYGIYAMELLINDMMKRGANRANLKAKCFGGANVLRLREDRQNEQTVGDVNVAFIKAFLANEKIPLISASLGGIHGRNVHFVGTDYSVFVKRIGESQERLLEKQERRYWRINIAQHQQRKSTAEFW